MSYVNIMDIISASNSNHVLTFRGVPLDHVIVKDTIVVNGNETVVDTLWIRGKQVCELLEYEDSNQALRKLVKEKYKKSLLELSNEPLSYNDGKKIYVTKDGMSELLSNQKGVNKRGVVEELADLFQCNLNFVSRTKEQDFIGAIMTVFAHKPHKKQFQLDNYRIDLYFTEAKIAVECDEFGHNNRDQGDEQRREKKIKKHLGGVFFRFNPDEKGFCVFRTINSLMVLMEERASEF